MELDCRSTVGNWPERYYQQLLLASTSYVTFDRDEVIEEKITAPAYETPGGTGVQRDRP